jgi:hypothetical protein
LKIAYVAASGVVLLTAFPDAATGELCASQILRYAGYEGI